MVKYRVTCVKTAEPIVMLFVLWAGTGPRNHDLDRGPDTHEKGNFRERLADCKA